MPPARRDLPQFLRFLVVGASNTLVTLVLLALLSRILDPRVAYTVVFALGLAYTTVLSRRYVFRAARSRARSAAFAGWYLAVYGLGLGVVHLLTLAGVTSPDLLALITVGVTAPVNFLGGRLIFRTDPLDRTDPVDKELAA
jgi:putative flippase GtrA